MGAVTSTVAEVQTSSSNTGAVIAMMIAALAAYFGPLLEEILSESSIFDGPTLLQ